MYWILGANGQLGQELQKLLKERGITFQAYTSKELDITDQDALLRAAVKTSPKVIFNAAAYTKVDDAEDIGLESNWAVNAQGVRNLAFLAKRSNAKLVHVSTDYVFEGTQEVPYTEQDIINPQNQYGKAKVAGEFSILNAQINAYIVRTSWVYGEFGANFVYTMQKLAEKYPHLTVVNDQLGRPTWTRDLAMFMLHLVETQQAYGIYNFSNNDTATWFDFAREILKNKDVEVTPVSSIEFPQKAYRPKFSVLDLEKAQATEFEIPTWQESLGNFLESIDLSD